MPQLKRAGALPSQRQLSELASAGSQLPQQGSAIVGGFFYSLNHGISAYSISSIIHVPVPYPTVDRSVTVGLYQIIQYCILYVLKRSRRQPVVST